MEYRAVGRSGLKVSALALGGWTTFGGSVRDGRVITEIIHAAFEAGINYFDMADVYARGACEQAMGRVLAQFPRQALVLASKCFWPMSESPNDRGLSRKHIVESVTASLRRLGTDYLDLYFCHRHDPDTPLEETIEALDDLVRQGKILYWGTSEWSGAQLRQAHQVAGDRRRTAPRVEQPQYSLLHRQRVEEEVRPDALECGMGLVVWSPLAMGLLTGKYDQGLPEGSRLARLEWLREKVYSEEVLGRTRRLSELAARSGHTPAQLSLAWLLAQKGVSSVITGATSVTQLRENLAALEVTLEPEVSAELESIFPPGGALPF
jgi:voltage-dependent potassium channel beta subunit